MKKKSGLADSPFFSKVSPETKTATPTGNPAAQTQEPSLSDSTLPDCRRNPPIATSSRPRWVGASRGRARRFPTVPPM